MNADKIKSEIVELLEQINDEGQLMAIRGIVGEFFSLEEQKKLSKLRKEADE